jgi:hypothetical protein
MNHKIRSFEQAESFLSGRMERNVPSIRSTTIVKIDPFTIAVRYHGTSVVLFEKSGRITLNSGGFRSVTTKRRMNEFSPVQVYQRNWTWYVKENGVEKEFSDYYTIGLPEAYDYKSSFLPLDG